jgi:hypothetical protein
MCRVGDGQRRQSKNGLANFFYSYNRPHELLSEL